MTSDGADPWTGSTMINLLMFLNTSIPMHYPDWQGAQAGIPNDGLQLLHLFKSHEKQIEFFDKCANLQVHSGTA